MKRAGTLLALLVCPAALLAEDRQEPSPTGPGRLSAHISAMVRADLPGFVPRKEEPAAPVADPGPSVARDPDLLELPKITVREKPPPKVDPLDLLVKSGREKKLARDFKNSLSGLDALLNGFSIPILSPSMAERGRAYRQQQQLEELNRVARAVRQLKPGTADALQKDASDAQRALDRQNRPPGDK